MASERSDVGPPMTNMKRWKESPAPNSIYQELYNQTTVDSPFKGLGRSLRKCLLVFLLILFTVGGGYLFLDPRYFVQTKHQIFTSRLNVTSLMTAHGFHSLVPDSNDQTTITLASLDNLDHISCYFVDSTRLQMEILSETDWTLTRKRKIVPEASVLRYKAVIKAKANILKLLEGYCRTPTTDMYDQVSLSEPLRIAGHRFTNFLNSSSAPRIEVAAALEQKLVTWSSLYPSDSKGRLSAALCDFWFRGATLAWNASEVGRKTRKAVEELRSLVEEDSRATYEFFHGTSGKGNVSLIALLHASSQEAIESIEQLQMRKHKVLETTVRDLDQWIGKWWSMAWAFGRQEKLVGDSCDAKFEHMQWLENWSYHATREHHGPFYKMPREMITKRVEQEISTHFAEMVFYNQFGNLGGTDWLDGRGDYEALKIRLWSPDLSPSEEDSHNTTVADPSATGPVHDHERRERDMPEM